MSSYPVLLSILEFFLARLAMLPYGLDSNVTKFLAILFSLLCNVFSLFSLCFFIIMPIVVCNHISIKCIIALLQDAPDGAT